MMFDWKGFIYILPLLFISLVAIPGIMMIGGMFHEWLHTQDFETESLCIDYTNNSFLYVLDKPHIVIESDQNLNDDSEIVSRHFEIYAIQGFLMGILSILILLCFFLTAKFLVKKRRDII